MHKHFKVLDSDIHIIEPAEKLLGERRDSYMDAKYGVSRSCRSTQKILEENAV